MKKESLAVGLMALIVSIFFHWGLGWVKPSFFMLAISAGALAWDERNAHPYSSGFFLTIASAFFLFSIL